MKDKKEYPGEYDGGGAMPGGCLGLLLGGYFLGLIAVGKIWGRLTGRK